MAVELAAAYISIIPETSKIAPGIKQALTGVESEGEKSGRGFGGKFSGAMGKAIKRSALATGATAGGVLAAGLTKGLGRLNSIEMAEAKLRGLGNSASDVSKIMENANAAVKGTAYGLDEAATTAAMAVASGIKPGAELEQVLKTTADTAGIAGASMSEMGQIFGSVAARGKLQGDDLMQLTSRGIPVLQMLADQLGVTSAEVSDMVSKGQIDFKTFESAMRAGVGGAALEAGNTVKGAMANMGAALGRVGATAAGPFFSQAAGAFTGVTKALDAMNGRLKPVMADVDQALRSRAIPALERFGTSASEAFKRVAASAEVRGALIGTVDAFSQLGRAAGALLPPLGRIAESLGKAAGALGLSTWSLFNSTLQVAGAAAEALAGPLQTVAGLMERHPALVTAAVAAWTGFKTLPGLMSKVTAAFAPMQSGISTVRALGAGVGDLRQYYQATGREVSRFDAAITMAATSSNTAMAAMGRSYLNASSGLKQMAASQQGAEAAMTRFAGTVKGVGVASLTGFKGAASGLMAMMGGPWGAALGVAVGAITAFITESQRLKAAQEANAQLAKVSANAYVDLFASMASGESATDAMVSKLSEMDSALQKVEETQSGWFRTGLAAVDAWTAKLTYSADVAEQTWGRQVQAQDEAAEHAKLAREGLEELGMTQEQIAAAVSGSAGEWEAFSNRLRSSGESGAAAADELQKLRDAHVQAQQTMEAVGPVAASVSEEIHKIAESSDDAATKASKLREQLLRLSGQELDAQEAAGGLTEELSRMASTTADVAGVQLTASGAIDQTSMAGVNLFNALNNLGDAFQASVGAGNDASEEFERMSPLLEELRVQSGLSEDAWWGVLQTLQMTPEQVQVTARAITDEAKMRLLAIREQIDHVDGSQSSVTIKANDEVTAALDSAGIKVSEFDQKTGTAKIDLRDEGVEAKLNNLIYGVLPQIDATRAAPTLGLFDDVFRANASNASSQLGMLNASTAVPQAGLNLDLFNANKANADGQIQELHGERPMPVADLVLGPLLGNKANADAQVQNLDSQRPTPVADLDNSPFMGSHGRSIQAAAVLAAQRPTAKALLDDSGFRGTASNVMETIRNIPRLISVSVIMRKIGDAITGHADGGVVGAYASGGRLPVTGPGTNEVDGILGVDGKGLPTARVDAGEWVINRRSSERYNGLLAAINQGDPRVDKVAKMLPFLADGGVAGAQLRAFAEGQEVNGYRASRSLEGAPYEWSGINWGDCSAAMSALARFSVGLDPFGGRFATGNQYEALMSMGFSSGLGGPGDFRIGWYNGGPYNGHTAGTLPDGTNVEMGGGRGNGQIGGGAAGAADPSFTDHAHISMGGGPTFEYGDQDWEYGDQDWVYADPSEFQAIQPADTSLSNIYATDSPIMHRGGADARMVELDGATARAAEHIDTETDGAFQAGSKKDNPLLSSSSWSEMGGSVVQKMVSGQIADVLNVFGIPDKLPPFIQAGQKWFQAMQDDQGRMLSLDAGRRAILWLADRIDSPLSVREAARQRGWDIDGLMDGDTPVEHGDMDPMEFIDYLESRYSSSDDAVRTLLETGTFDQGGQASGIGALLKNTIKPERVLSPDQTRAFESFVFDQLPALQEMGDMQETVGALSSTVTKALPMLMQANSLKDIAGKAVSGAVRAGGYGLTALASGGVDALGGIATAGLSAIAGGAGALTPYMPNMAGLLPMVAGAIPGVTMATSLASTGVSMGGRAATDLAAWYAGEVTSGIVGAVEQFSQEVFGATPLAILQENLKPVTAGAALSKHVVDSGIAQLEDFANSPVVEQSAQAIRAGNVYNFNAVNFDAAQSAYRREVAKQMRGVVGAR